MTVLNPCGVGANLQPPASARHSSASDVGSGTSCVSRTTTVLAGAALTARKGNLAWITRGSSESRARQPTKGR